ncbi:MAG TPA: thioredoxin family protein [Candidatus Sulfomarinibacteraceae bacterium]|nr:thioredoxin family protein [Candidatus Sulfomarinibacteraceae bacterium]
MLQIKVLGPGCANCEKLEAVAKQAVATSGIDAHIEKITDFAQIMSYNVLATPGLVINEQLVSAGRIPSEAEVSTWVVNALEAS